MPFFGKYVYLPAIILSSCLSVVYGQKPSLENPIQYNSKVGTKNTKFSDLYLFSVRGKDKLIQGRILENKGDSIIFDHLSIINRYARNQVNSIQRQPVPMTTLDKDYGGFLDHPVRMLGTPTAHMLGQGNFTLSSYYFFVGELNVGVTDRLNMGAGISFLPNIADSTTNKTAGQLFYMSAKYKIRDRKHLDLAVGLNAFRIPHNFLFWQLNKSKILSYFYLAASADYGVFNFSASIGQGFLDEFPVKRYLTQYIVGLNYMYTFSLAGSVLISDQLSIVMDNWWVNGIFNVPGAGRNTGSKVPFIPLIGGRYYTDLYGAGLGLGNFLIPGVSLFGVFYIDGYYFF